MYSVIEYTILLFGQFDSLICLFDLTDLTEIDCVIVQCAVVRVP